MRVLLIEDNDGDADLVTEALSDTADADILVDRVERLSAAVNRLHNDRFDVILLDLSLPDASGLDALHRIRKAAPHAPVVVLTGLIDRAAGTKAIQHGAQDFLQKGQIEGGEILRAIRYARERAQYGERERLLADVSVALGSARAREPMLSALHDTLSRDYADWCAFEGGSETSDSEATLPALPSVETRPARLFPALAEAAGDDPDRTRIDALVARGLVSAMIVPFDMQGRNSGWLTLGRKATSASYGPADLALSEEIARRAVAAIDYVTLLDVAQRERLRAEVASRARDEFLATLSHELRTPLNAILGWTLMLRSGKVAPEKHPRALETIERNARSQVKLIEDVLDVSRVVMGKVRLKIIPVDLSGVLTEALETIRPAAQAKGVELDIAIDTEVRAVQADADRLLQVLWNLLSNAVKFTGRGGRVAVRLREFASGVEVEVADTGLGIAPEFLPHLFERFRQGDSSVTRSQGGLGLGLAIARHLTELQGGTLHGSSPGVGAGSTFILTLPLDPISTRQSTELGRDTPKWPPADAANRVTLAGLAVLVVEDDEDARILMGAMLESQGASVTLASSAEEGLSLLRLHRPDVLLSDIAMAGTSGYDLIKKVRALTAGEGGRTPAVAVTAFARSDDRVKALTMGFDQYVSKPVAPDELAAAIAGLSTPQRGVASRQLDPI